MRTSRRSRDTKRLDEAPQSSSRRSGGNRGRSRGRGRGATKGRKAVIDARASIRQQNQSSRGGGRRGGGPTSGRLGGRISDARQILNSQFSRGGGGGGGGRSRTASSRPRVYRAAAASAIVNSLSLSTISERNMFSQAVRAAMAPVLAPFLTPQSSSSSRISGSANNNGPCALRVANLAQSVTVNDLNDLFNSFPGFVGASFESGGIAIVSFSQRDGAANAQDEYNNRELDGRTMVIQLDTSGGAQSASSRLGPKPQMG